jgi:protein-disulfide isomerase
VTKSATTARTKRARRNSDNNKIGIWIIGISVGIVLLVVLAVALNSRQASVTVAAPELPAEWLNRNVMGNPDATVTVQTWEDFLCPACRQWATTVKPRLLDDYIKPGTVKLEFRQFPLSGHQPGASMAAMASLCAADQDAFWVYHDRLFVAQDRGQAAFELDNLVQYADELGLDSRAFMQCMSSQQYREEVAASANEAIGYGFPGTPTILVNGTPITDWSSYDELKAAIEAQLAAGG